jgi:hypothetical protein
MNREAKEKEIAGILKQSETIDREPPHRALPIGSGEWIELKVKQITSLFPEFKVKVDCPECRGEWKWIARSDSLHQEERICSYCIEGKVLKDLAHGVTGEIIKIEK